MSRPSQGERPLLVGNRWALAGTVVYFLEWVAIIAAGGIPSFDPPDTPAGTIVHNYTGHENAYGWAAGWFGVVLLGRILYAVAVRRCLVSGPGGENVRVLADLGVFAMTVGVVVEVSSYGLVAAGAALADHGASASTLRTVDLVGGDLNMLLWGPTGVAVVCLAVGMLLDGRFPRILPWVGVVGGGALVVQALGFEAPSQQHVAMGLQSAATLFWVWMIWSAVLLFVRSPRRHSREQVGAPSADLRR